MKNKNDFPVTLWLLPVCFGTLGGVIAALIANIKYQASWWELLVAGFVVSGVTALILWGLMYQTLTRGF